jgi:uncharacterized protein (DUF2236 family)
MNRLMTIGLLPDPVRMAYGFGWTAAQERWLAGVTWGLRLGRRVLPAALACWREARRAP